MRQPIGIEIVLGVLTNSLGDLGNVSLADLGCGPGIYSFPLARRLKQVLGIDISHGQISQANSRLAGEGPTSLSFKQGDIRELAGLKDGQFDAVLISLVLHHLEESPGDRIGHQMALGEAFRILGSPGVLILGVCSQPQVYDGAWYCRLMPRASEILAARHPGLEETTQLAERFGFRPAGRFVPVDGVLQGQDYFDGLGPLRQEWRDGDSIFSLLSEDELNVLRDKIREMDREGTLTDYVRRHDEVRKSIGQVTFLTFVKSGSKEE